MSCMICAVNHKKGCSGVQDGYLKDDVHTALRYAKVWIVGVWAAMFPMRSVTCPRVPSQIVCYASLSSVSMKGAISSYPFSLYRCTTLIPSFTQSARQNPGIFPTSGHAVLIVYQRHLVESE
jgi:hypothetical protein